MAEPYGKCINCGTLLSSENSGRWGTHWCAKCDKTQILENDRRGPKHQELIDEIDRLTRERNNAQRELVAIRSWCNDASLRIDRLNKLVTDLTAERDGLLAAIPEAWKED